jgi:hypothetical protein
MYFTPSLTSLLLLPLPSKIQKKEMDIISATHFYQSKVNKWNFKMVKK